MSAHTFTSTMPTIDQERTSFLEMAMARTADIGEAIAGAERMRSYVRTGKDPLVADTHAVEPQPERPDLLTAMLSGLPSEVLRGALCAAEKREYRENRLRSLEARESMVRDALRQTPETAT